MAKRSGETTAFVRGQWRAFDRVLMMINSLTSEEGQTPDAMKRHIYGEVHAMRPEVE